MQRLALELNQIDGNIPPSIGLLSNLELLRLYNNSLTGSLPSELGLLRNLTILEVGGNSVNGPIPLQLGNLNSLMRLKMNDMNLSGAIPSELGLLGTKLLVFDVTGNNGLSGALQEELCTIGNNHTCPNSDTLCALLFDCTGDLCGCGCPCNS